MIIRTFTLISLSLLVGCATSFDPKPLPADHPASAEAPEAPRSARRHLLQANAVPARTETQSNESDHAPEAYWTCVMHPESMQPHPATARSAA